MRSKLFIALVLLVGYSNEGFSQWDPVKNCLSFGGNCVPNTIIQALPFLRIAPDARGGAMGDAGIAISPDANSMHYNAANLAFATEESSLSATYTPWLRELNLNDVFLAYLTGYKKLDENQAVGVGLRFFSLGSINFVDVDQNSLGVGKPREWEIAVAYSRKLGDKLSASLTGKYIYSNLATGQIVNGIEINSATSFGADIGLAYRDNKFKIGGYRAELAFGLSITNIGAKVGYNPDQLDRAFIPTNLGIGSYLRIDLDDYNSLAFALDINKLLIPTPIFPTIFDENGGEITNPEFDKNNNGVADFRERSVFDAMISSFGDAQGGLSEELQEFSFSIGAEYWYDKQFAIRAGYYYEHPLKGARKYLTFGVGLKYNAFGMNISYLAPTSIVRNPLDNTLRFGMTVNMAEFAAQNAQ